jgi:hypothetical protein
VVGGVRNTISTVDLRAAQDRLRIEENKRKDVNLKRDIAVDSLRTYQRKVLELDNNTDVAGELGPLKYLSGLTGYPMDKIINILLLVIIFVFDPLAVALVVAANFAYNQAFPKKRENLYGEKVESKPSFIYSEEDEKRMDVIGQNGNDGEHYDNSERIKELENKLENIAAYTAHEREKKAIENELKRLRDDDNTKTY